MDAATITALATGITGVIAAIAGLVTALKAHQKINDHYENDHTDMQNVPPASGK